MRKRTSSRSSTDSSEPTRQQELSSMYDYLAKIILIGPSGTGKSCLLHRLVKNEWRILSSQTIGVEFASKIVKVGNGPRRKRVKLQVSRISSTLSARTWHHQLMPYFSSGILQVPNDFDPSLAAIIAGALVPSSYTTSPHIHPFESFRTL